MITDMLEETGSGTTTMEPPLETRKALRVLVVDDHAIVRLGLKQLVLNEFKSAMVAEAEDGDKALEMVRKQPWDVVLLDITMPGSSGLDVLKRMIIFRPGLAVLMLSMHPEDHYAVRVLKEGAAGYVPKNADSEIIVRAIKKALAGQKYVSDALAEKLALNLGNCAQGKPHEALSSREEQVMRMIGEGKSVKEIGFELGLSGRTVSTYRARLLDKMNLGSNAEIIRYALVNKLVE